MPDQDRVAELFLSFWVARGVMAAVEIGIFDLLETASLTVSEVCARIGLAGRPARGLLDTCLAAGLLVRDGDRYHNTEDASRYLTSASEYSIKNWALDERWCWRAWESLETSLRTNSPGLPPDDSGYHTFPADYFLDFLHGHTLANAERLAAVIDCSGVTRIMDVGGGSGATSIALCRAFPSLRSVVVDRAEVLEKTKGHIVRADLAGRVETRAANFFTDRLPQDCDAAVIANVLHDFSPEKARTILSRVAAAIPAGAPLYIMEMAPNDDRSSPPLVVAFSLAMLVNTEGGDAYTIPQYREFLDASGFDFVRAIPLGGRIVTAAIEARRR